MMTTVYSVRDLTKVYRGEGMVANDHVSFDIQPGEVFGLLGPNGAGKTTLVRQLAGLTHPTSGHISLFGRDVLAAPDLVPCYVALQPQNALAFSQLRVREVILLTGRLRGLRTAEATRQAMNLMEEFGLGPLATRVCRTLSGGQQRLLTLSATFAGSRPVAILDEPTNDLDPAMRRVVWDKVRALRRSGGTVILVTHNVLEAEQVLDRVGIMHGGRLISLDTPAALKRKVDGRLRIEISFREGYDEPARLGRLATLGDNFLRLSASKWALYCQREAVAQGMSTVLSTIEADALEDIRLITPTLEDVYISLTEGEQLA